MKYWMKRAGELGVMFALGVSTALNITCMMAIAASKDLTFVCAKKEEE